MDDPYTEEQRAAIERLAKNRDNHIPTDDLNLAFGANSETLYVVRCSIVGEEKCADMMPLEDAQRLADQYNDKRAGQCQGDHTVEEAHTPN
jgi:hypothetical protein